MIMKIFQGIMRVAEIDVLNAGFGTLLNAAKITENPVGDAAARVGDFAG